MAYFLRKIIVGSLLLVLFFPETGARILHVTTEGKKEANGSIYSPMSLEFAFSSINRAGDTIMIHGGDYYGNYTCWTSGAEGNPLVIMPYNNEVVRIIGTGDNNMTLSLNGDWCVVRDLIITQTKRKRFSSGNHSWPDDVNTEAGVTLVGRGLEFINNIIHDTYGSGILGSGSNGFDAVVSGNIIFNTGWIGSGNGHGHGMYLQNNEGNKQAVNNIVFNTYGHGLQFYTTGGQKLDGMSIAHNIVFNAGVPASKNSTGTMRNMMLGGNASVNNLTVKDNYTYFPDNSTGTGMQVGYNTVSESCKVEGNYVANGAKVFVMYRFKSAIFRNNTIVGQNKELLTSLFFPEDGSSSENYEWNTNSYFSNQERFFDANHNRMLDFEGWKNQFGFDRLSKFSHGAALRNHIDVIPNQYEKGRAHLVIYNWERKDSASVDLSSVLEIDDQYTIYDVENIFEPVLEGDYTGGSVRIPLHLSKVIQPTGDGVYPIVHTDIDFGCFLLVSNIKGDRLLSKEAPDKLAITKTYPNPTKDFVIIEYLLPEKSTVKASIYDFQGHIIIQKKENGFAGNNKFLINLADLKQNIYMLLLDDGFSSDSCNIVVNR